MIAATLDEPQTSAPVKGRGGWYRNTDGRAVVTDPKRANRVRVYDGGSSLWEFADGPYRGDPIYGLRGTWVHDLCALACNNQQPTDEFIVEGDALGIPEALQRHIYRNWIDTRAAHGITTLHIELPIVHDGWRVATNADRIEQGADGTVVGADIKTAGDVIKAGYHVQLAVIPGSVLYDQDSGERASWPQRPDPTYGHIWHYPLTAALKCDPGSYPTWTLYRVDLRHGHELGNTLAALKYDALHPASFAVRCAPIASVPEVAETADRDLPHPPPVATSGDGSHTTNEPPIGSTGTEAPPTPQQQHAALDTLGTPDEGGPADSAAFDALERAYHALNPEGRAWIADMSREAMQAGVSWHAKEARTVRRFELIRALVIIADTGVHEDEGAVRSLLYHVHGDRADWPALTVGHLVGSLGAEDAAKFARHCWEVVG
jgi:hypothetical protein